MKILLLYHGSTKQDPVAELCRSYLKRLQKYVSAEEYALADLKNTRHCTPQQIQAREGDQLLQFLKPGDQLILCDEKGKSFTSRNLALQTQTWMNAGPRRMLWVIGGAYGFDARVVEKAQALVSLSPLTFSHQIVRALLAEQLSRVFSILHRDPYHNA